MAFPAELASVTNDIQVDGRWTVRVRVLTTLDAARADVLVELLAGLTMAPEPQRIERARALDPAKLVRADAAVTRILCECVEAGSMDGGPFEPLRLVPERAQHDVSVTPPRIWAGRIPGSQRGALVAAALVLHAEAEGILRPFRCEQDASAHDPQGGQVLRQDARGGSHAAA